MLEERDRVSEGLEREIMELESRVRILKTKVRPVASVVDLRPRPAWASRSRCEGVFKSPYIGSMNAVKDISTISSVASLGGTVRSAPQQHSITSSNRTSHRSMFIAHDTFGLFGRNYCPPNRGLEVAALRRSTGELMKLLGDLGPPSLTRAWS